MTLIKRITNVVNLIFVRLTYKSQYLFLVGFMFSGTRRDFHKTTNVQINLTDKRTTDLYILNAPRAIAGVSRALKPQTEAYCFKVD